MDNSEIKKELKTIGLYVVVILALLRIIVVPLHGAVAVKKNTFNEYYHSYVVKYRLVEKIKAQQKKKPATDKQALVHRFYRKDALFSTIQADMIEMLLKLAEKKGFNVLDFEMLEPAVGKDVSEVPVLIRMEGKAIDFIDILKSIAQGEKALQVKSLEINMATGQEMRYFLTITAFRVER